MKLYDGVIFCSSGDPETDRMFPYFMRAVSPDFVIFRGVRIYTGAELYPDRSLYQVLKGNYKPDEFLSLMKSFTKSFHYKGFFWIHSNRHFLKNRTVYVSWINMVDSSETLLGEVEIGEAPVGKEKFVIDYCHASCVKHIPFMALSIIASQHPEIGQVREEYRNKVNC